MRRSIHLASDTGVISTRAAAWLRLRDVRSAASAGELLADVAAHDHLWRLQLDHLGDMRLDALALATARWAGKPPAVGPVLGVRLVIEERGMRDRKCEAPMPFVRYRGLE